MFQPDFSTQCLQCGGTPCVLIPDHICPETELCGQCFFGDRLMVDWALWNEEPESTD